MLLDRAVVNPAHCSALFWHHFLVHQSSNNASCSVRQGLIARWHTTHPAFDEWRDLGGGLWKWWTEEVKQADVSVGGHPTPPAKL